MISSSKNIIKEWNPEQVRNFVPVLKVSQPVIRELSRQDLESPRPKEKAGWEIPDGEPLEETEEIPDEEAEASLELQEARRQAEELLREAREESERIKEEARQEGFARGQEEGWQRGMAEAVKKLEETLEQQKQSVRQELSKALESIEQAKSRCLQNYLDQLKDCSFAVAEKVIHTSLEASGDIIKRMIVFETEKLKKTVWLKIYMEKMDYDMMMETDADLVTELSKVSDNIKFIVMEKENRGSCIIETPEEILDIGVETQMENIRDITGTIRL